MRETEDEIKRSIVEDLRPWGRFEQYAHNEVCTVKVITVKPNQTLKQFHEERDELGVILDDGLEILKGGETKQPKAGEVIVIPRKTIHRLASHGTEGRVLEISFGVFREDDIVRLEDAYGRE